MLKSRANFSHLIFFILFSIQQSFAQGLNINDNLNCKGVVGDATEGSVHEKAAEFFLPELHDHSEFISSRKWTLEEAKRYFDNEISEPFRTFRKMAAAKDLKPQLHTHYEGYDFFFSPEFKIDDGRSFRVMYVPSPEGKILARMIYLSLSDGKWRSSPWIVGSVLEKGKIHYTQQTQLREELASAFETEDKDYLSTTKGHRQLSGSDTELFLGEFDDKKVKATSTFLLESLPYVWASNEESRILLALAPGRLTYVTRFWISEAIQSINTALEGPCKDRVPDFTRPPVRRYFESHTLLSGAGPDGQLLQDIQVEVFEVVQGERVYEWHMARDTADRTWISRIRPKETGINSFGTDIDVIDSGILTSKPLEYVEQAKALKYVPEWSRAFPKEPKYLDITPFLSQFLPIRLYRENYYRVRRPWRRGLLDLLSDRPADQGFRRRGPHL